MRSARRSHSRSLARYESQLHGVAQLDAGIPGITLPNAITIDPARALKTWHRAFHVVPGLPETLLAARERKYVGWFLRAKSLFPNTFDDADIDHHAAAVAADGGPGPAWQTTEAPPNRRARTTRPFSDGT
jgi:hypothetical protein